MVAEVIGPAFQVLAATLRRGMESGEFRDVDPEMAARSVMAPILLALWTANLRVYGARKLWIAARRAGHDIGRDQVARLMGQFGIRGRV